ncbi:MAG: hypothetical protein CMJ77_00700 [Planctomycetaceae bacterium]|nr:hypothetical protein [Planctomycetaceae bacterium]
MDIQSATPLRFRATTLPTLTSSRRKSQSILLVEDNELDAHLIKVLLSHVESDPAGEFKLHWVQTLKDALDWLDTYSVDVILLDLNLSDSEGLQTLSSLRAVVQDKPVVVLTEPHDPEVGTQAIRHGAQDYLCKNEAMGEHLVRSLRFSLERIKRQRFEFELSGAGLIQNAILTQSLPQLPGLDLAACYEPAGAVAGDFYDFIPLHNNSIAVIVGDVSGKGLGPALLMAETRGMLRSILEWEQDPGRVLTKINSLISTDCIEGAFVTLFLAIVSPSDPTVRYAAAGHQAYLLDQNGRPKSRLAGSDPPVGIRDDHVYDSKIITPLNRGDQLFCCTDGITEGFRREKREFFGMDRVFEIIQSNPRASLQTVLNQLFDSVKHFRDYRHDDMTAAMIRLSS